MNSIFRNSLKINLGPAWRKKGLGDGRFRKENSLFYHPKTNDNTGQYNDPILSNFESKLAKVKILGQSCKYGRFWSGFMYLKNLKF